jgi:hypothetical protein
MIATQSADTPRPPRHPLHIEVDIRGFEYQLKVFPDGRIVEHVEDFVNRDAEEREISILDVAAMGTQTLERVWAALVDLSKIGHDHG